MIVLLVDRVLAGEYGHSHSHGSDDHGHNHDDIEKDKVSIPVSPSIDGKKLDQGVENQEGPIIHVEDFHEEHISSKPNVSPVT
jgi:hypothetical protein